MANLSDLQDQFRSMERRLERMEHDCSADRATLREQSGRIGMVEDEVRTLAAVQDTSTQRILAAIEAKQPAALGAQIQASTPPIWESEQGRRVVWWVVSGAVLCSLAIGGGLTSDQLFRYIGGGVTVQGHTGATQRVPEPQLKPVPSP